MNAKFFKVNDIDINETISTMFVENVDLLVLYNLDNLNIRYIYHDTPETVKEVKYFQLLPDKYKETARQLVNEL